MKKNKLGASKATVNGIQFDSKFEAQTYEAFLILEQEGFARNIELQSPITIIPTFHFGRTTQRPCRIIVDFKLEALVNGEWVEVYFETKGYQTDLSKLKVKLLKFLKKDLRTAGLFTYVLFHGGIKKNIDDQVYAVRKAICVGVLGNKGYEEVYGKSGEQ